MLNITNLGGGSGNAAYRIITVPSGVTEYSFNWDVCNAVDHVDASVWSGSYSGSFTVESLAGSVKITFTDETTEAFQMYVCILSGEAAPDGSPDEAYYTKPEIDGRFFTLKEQSLAFENLQAVIRDSRVTENTYIVAYFTDETLQAAANAGVVVDSGDGTITFTATTAPSVTLVCDIVCRKEA